MSTVELSKWGFQFNQYESMAQLLPSLQATAFYEENPGRKHNLSNIISTERYIFHIQVLLEC
jgi:hypothetical protein